MKVIESKPVSMAEAKEIMLKREKEGDLSYEQKLALSHLKKFTKLKKSDTEKLKQEISSVIHMSPERLIQIVNVLPTNADEVRMIFAGERFSIKEDEINKIIEIVKKYK